METNKLEQELKNKLNQKYGSISGGVVLGKSIRTFDEWGRAGFRVSKGERAISVNVNGSRQCYFWWTQTWSVSKHKAWKKREIEISFDIEPSGRMTNERYN